MKVQVFRLFTARVNIHEIFDFIFQTEGEFFLKVWVPLQCHKR